MTFSEFSKIIFPKKFVIAFFLVYAGLVVIFLIVGLIIYFSVFTGDTYKLGNIEIPSISYVLQEQRSILSVNTQENFKTITFRTVNHPTEDIDTYVNYLLRQEGFEPLEDENTGKASQTIIVHKKYGDLQTSVFVYIDFYISHYVITIRKEAVS